MHLAVSEGEPKQRLSIPLQPIRGSSPLPKPSHYHLGLKHLQDCVTQASKQGITVFRSRSTLGRNRGNAKARRTTLHPTTATTLQVGLARSCPIQHHATVRRRFVLVTRAYTAIVLFYERVSLSMPSSHKHAFGVANAQIDR